MTTPLRTRLPDGDLAVATSGLTKRYGKQTALQNVALQVPVGAVYLLVAPNGAGKSTTLKLLLDLVRADSGTADVFGLNTRECGPEVRADIGYVPEQTDWGYGWMRLARLLEHHARYFPTWDTASATRRGLRRTGPRCPTAGRAPSSTVSAAPSHRAPRGAVDGVRSGAGDRTSARKRRCDCSRSGTGVAPGCDSRSSQQERMTDQ